jgi:hypothetical protein
MAHLLTPRAVLSFPHLFSPIPKIKGGDPADLVYSCSLLFAPAEQKTPEFKAMQQAVIDAAKEKLGANVNLKTLDLPFHDGASKDYEGYGPGVVYINARSKKKPGIVGRRLQDITDPEDVYAGQIVIASVSAFGWSFSGKKGVSFGLNHIQVVDKDAARIDGRVAANKAFSPLDDLEDADSPF